MAVMGRRSGAFQLGIRTAAGRGDREGHLGAGSAAVSAVTVGREA